jgi:hypothetical protein
MAQTTEPSETDRAHRERGRGRGRLGVARPSRWALVAALVLVTAAFLALARTNGGDGPANGSGAATSAARTHAGLCAAISAAQDDDVSEARAAFYDRSHDGLHELAASTAEVDRAAAAQLLETKQRVEALLEGTPPPGDLSAALGPLVDATARAAGVVGEAVNRCE